MKGNRDFKIKSALLFDDAKFAEIDKYIRRIFPEIEYTLYCTGEVKLHPETLDNILEYENATYQHIVGVRIAASTSISQSCTLDIAIGKPISSFWATATSSLSFDDSSWAHGFHTELRRRILAARPWYWPVSILGFKILLPVLISTGPLLITAIIYILELTTDYTPPVIERATVLEENLFFLFLFSSFGIGYLLDFILHSFFPKVCFCIGRQKDLYRRRQWLLRLVFGIIGLGIAINLISNMLSQ